MRKPRTFSTSAGQRGAVVLADGSKVMLAPESEIVVFSADSGRREVRLVGEAYFDVVHDEHHPFIVHTGTAIVRDVGTRFAVRRYPTDASLRVVVTDGEVHVHPDTAAPSARLSAGMLARVGPSGTITLQTSVDTSRYVAFTRGRLVFDDTPLREAARDLERWYDIEIRFTDHRLADRRITGTIVEQGLATLLDQLSSALDVHASRLDRMVTLDSRRSKSGL